MTVLDDDCRHVDGCDGCQFVFLSCQVEGCASADVTARLVDIGRGRTVRVLLCDRHGLLEHVTTRPPFGVAAYE